MKVGMKGEALKVLCEALHRSGWTGDWVVVRGDDRELVNVDEGGKKVRSSQQ